MSEQKVFIFGAGYSGKAFARQAPADVAISGTTRSPDKFAALEAAGIEPLLFDGKLTPEIRAKLAETTQLVISAAPGDAGDPVLDVALDTILHHMPRLRWIGYLSTVGVYGDYGGKWIDEAAACHPKSGRSQARLEAENQWHDLGEKAGRPVAILRLSGIYGPGRNAFVNLENGTAKRLVKQDQVFNRIHVDDIAGALWHLIEADRGGVFNVTDNEPAPPQDVVAYAAKLMGVEAPPEIPFETAQLSPMARSFYGENKRVANTEIRATGYDFRYPNYRAAFDRMWAEGSWRGEGDGDKRSPMRQQ
ncbi:MULTISPECIES: SDR family oxidoreductase [Hyphomicrobiales]|uniref:SDR family oxidoreductase n=1 Tax=Hyphomicrobiales TaxID=356 RepID=UPI00037D696F|nr:MULTISPECIES: SDR family oxidoreductase [Phyllobacteriaceae]MCX8572733.1 SDR family oxidoreductase [Aminobacter sp. MET-1]